MVRCGCPINEDGGRVINQPIQPRLIWSWRPPREHGAIIPDVRGARELHVLSHTLRELIASLTSSQTELALSHQALARMEDMAYQDRLTSLPNRRFFERYLDVALAQAQTGQGQVMAL